MKDIIFIRFRSVRNSISVFIVSISDKVLEVVLVGCEFVWGVVKDIVEYVVNIRAGRLVFGGVDLVLGGIEKVVEFFFLLVEKELGICY